MRPKAIRPYAASLPAKDLTTLGTMGLALKIGPVKPSCRKAFMRPLVKVSGPNPISTMSGLTFSSLVHRGKKSMVGIG